MKKIYQLLLIVVYVFLITSCTGDFEAINTNPNSPDHIDQPEFLLPAILKNSSTTYFRNTLSRGGIVSDYFEDSFTSMFGSSFDATDTERYYFESLRDVQTIIDKSDDANTPHLLGIGIILKSWMFQVMTDLYGDFPYTQALKLKNEGINSPVYDRQEDIYYDLLKSLEKANTLLSQQSRERITKDILFGGDVSQWQKFANGLRIRLLIRMSNKKDLKINVANELQKIVSDQVKNPLLESNNDNAVFSFLNADGNYAPSYTSTPADFNNSRFLTTTLYENLKKLNDNRIHIYASPTTKSVSAGKPDFAGVPNCLNSADLEKYNGGQDYNSTMSILFLPRTVNPNLASPTAPQTIILTYAEVQLNLAEARERNLISIGDASIYYKNGIKASFDYWASRIPTNFVYPKASDIVVDEAYFQQNQVTYNGSQEAKLVKIHLQKWLALYFCGFEGWSEWRRTGIPTEISTTPPNGYISNSSIKEWPRRLTYPMFEQTYNNKNYKDALSVQGSDNLTTRVWWNK